MMKRNSRKEFTLSFSHSLDFLSKIEGYEAEKRRVQEDQIRARNERGRD
jgi:hypothetical protein